MQPPSSQPSSPASSAAPPEKIRQLPEAAQAAFREFRAHGNPAALDPLIFAVLEYYAPRPPAQPLATLPGAARLIDDLGFDSLSITEVVFFFEDLFEIRITNEEILAVRSLEELRAFVHAKVATRATS